MFKGLSVCVSVYNHKRCAMWATQEKSLNPHLTLVHLRQHTAANCSAPEEKTLRHFVVLGHYPMYMSTSVLSENSRLLPNPQSQIGGAASQCPSLLVLWLDSGCPCLYGAPNVQNFLCIFLDAHSQSLWGGGLHGVHPRTTFVSTIPTVTPDLPSPRGAPQIDHSGPQTFPTKHAA